MHSEEEPNDTDDFASTSWKVDCALSVAWESRVVDEGHVRKRGTARILSEIPVDVINVNAATTEIRTNESTTTIPRDLDEEGFSFQDIRDFFQECMPLKS